LPLQDPLKTLGLKSTATPDEIRQAYRDLVKVWHPDRFGNDARVRAKAEEQLKAINAAFHALECSGFGSHEPAAAPRPPSPERPPVSRPHVSRDRILRGWLYVGSILLIAAMAGFAVHAFSTSQSHSAAPVTQQPSTPIQPAAAKPSRKAPQLAGVAEPSGKPDFQVWSLSQADTDRVQLACASHPAGSESYRRCIKAQLDALRQFRGAPDMAGLNTAEREAAEQACANPRTKGGASEYSRCLRRQIAALAAEPVRPDLSTFSAADRNSIQAACAAETKGGAAEYNRCLIRFARTLSDAQRGPTPMP
jgi:hypothetical protein